MHVRAWVRVGVSCFVQVSSFVLCTLYGLGSRLGPSKHIAAIGQFPCAATQHVTIFLC